MIFSECFGDVSGCFEDVFWMFGGYVLDALKMFSGCFGDVSGCFGDA